MNEHETSHLPPSFWGEIKKRVFGPARNLKDPSLGHQISLAAFLAWVGLGADGLSSSAYGPEEAYRALGTHTYLAIFLVIATAATVFIISFAYSRIVEHFPSGGGGYMVATKLLGRPAGLVSGCALLVDYVLTVTVSIAGGGDALFSLLPLSWQVYKLPVEFLAIFFLMIMNVRGIKESVSSLIPIFMTFIVTHFILVFGGILIHLPQIHEVHQGIQAGFQSGIKEMGAWGLFLLFLRAYSLGGGTYTGIEAVSNGVSILQEPRVKTGKRTMLYMAVSLALTAGGLLLCYMLAEVKPVHGQTLNAVVAMDLMGRWHLGGLPVGIWLATLTIGAEAVLLLVAAQTGFIDGPRVMANMASDSWIPRRFAALSDRLTMQNGIIVMGAAAMALLAYTRGHIGILVVMYSVNVFLTFSLSQLGMIGFFFRSRKTQKKWLQEMLIQITGFTLCFAILMVMIFEKFREGAWVTVLLTCSCVALCFWIRRHYYETAKRILEIDRAFQGIPLSKGSLPEFDPESPTAVILVGGYSGLGIHIFLNIFRFFPGAFKNVVFLNVGLINSDFFKSKDQVQAITDKSHEVLSHYVKFSEGMSIPARAEFRLGTEVVETVSELSVEVAEKYSRCVFFAGEIVFENPQWYYRILHNETAYAIQRRIRFLGLPMVILPIRIRN